MKNTPKDCKCGAKYVTGLRSYENGQMVDGNNQFTCFRCYNEENAARLKMEDEAYQGEKNDLVLDQTVWAVDRTRGTGGCVAGWTGSSSSANALG